MAGIAAAPGQGSRPDRCRDCTTGGGGPGTVAIDGTRVGTAAAGCNRSAGKAADNTGIRGSGRLAAETATGDGAAKAVYRCAVKFKTKLQCAISHWVGCISLMTPFARHFLIDHMGGVGAKFPAGQDAGGRISEAVLAKSCCNGWIAVAGITTGAKSFAMPVAVGAVIAVGPHMVEFALSCWCCSDAHWFAYDRPRRCDRTWCGDHHHFPSSSGF